jgi:hypothetical protein
MVWAPDFVAAFEAQLVEQPPGMRQAACSIHAHSASKTRVNALMRHQAIVEICASSPIGSRHLPQKELSAGSNPAWRTNLLSDRHRQRDASARRHVSAALTLCSAHKALRTLLDGAIGSQCGRRRLASQYGRQRAIHASRLTGVATERRFRSSRGRPCMWIH